MDLNELVLAESSVVRTDEDGMAYRDLNGNGRLDIYEDPRQPIEARVEDLLGQLTLAEKAGLVFISGSQVNPDGSLEPIPNVPFPGTAKEQLVDLKIHHFNFWQIPDAQAVANWHNNLQKLAEQSRLGIPVTIASDPRNHFSEMIFSLTATDFSQWCETLGMAAIGDPELVREFADIARREYLAVGIRVALHPQIDLATEPRWPRINNTFGENAELTAVLTKAYIEGFQGAELNHESVACMTKHFPAAARKKTGLTLILSFKRGRSTLAITLIIISSRLKLLLKPTPPR